MRKYDFQKKGNVRLALIYSRYIYFISPMESCIPSMHKVFLTLLQTTDLDYTEISWVYALFFFFIFDVYILIFICDIGTNVLRSQICH